MTLHNLQVNHIPPLSTEHAEQCVVVDYCRLRKVPVFAIPNGGTRNKAEAAKLKAEGVSAGVPDLFIPVPTADYHGLFIEMKYGKGRTSKEQDEWLELLHKNGYLAQVCYGADSAMEVIDTYLQLRR